MIENIFLYNSISFTQYVYILLIIIGSFVIHYIADFLFTKCPNDEFSCDTKSIASHIMIYAALIFNYYIAITFFISFFSLNRVSFINNRFESISSSIIIFQLYLTLINVISHSIIDFIVFSKRSIFTSNRSYAKFWKIAGIDQLFHYIVLSVTSSLYGFELFTKYM